MVSESEGERCKPKRTGGAGRRSRAVDDDERDERWLYARARRRFGLDRAEFLSISPRELYLLLEADEDCDRDRYAAAGLIAAQIWNVNNDWDKRPQGFTAADFMPGAVVKSEQDELAEFAEAVLRGETFDAPDPAEIERCRRELGKTFKNIL